MIIAMSTAYHRKKQPEQVRQAILDTACHLAAHEGLGKVSIQALADAVGVTKGGVFHHFPNKKALVHAVFQHLVGELDRDINDRLAEEDGSYGSFTRAYVRVTFEDEVFHGHEAWRALCMSMANDPDGNAMEFSAEITRHPYTMPAGEWPHVPKTLNLWGTAIMRS